MYSAYSDYIGFNATMQVNMTRNGPVCFTLGSNDASALWLDSSASALISLGKYDTYNTETKVVYLAEGIHDLMLRYYDVQGNARVSFYCDSDITMLYP